MKKKLLLAGAVGLMMVGAISVTNAATNSVQVQQEFQMHKGEQPPEPPKDANGNPLPPPDREQGVNGEQPPEPPKDANGNPLPPPDKQQRTNGEQPPEPPKDVNGNPLPPPDHQQQQNQ